ncbi:hypothetical protein FJ364_01530, partial [Candidatus Dependentiae bacterium]|nr:hypothetical protein [Candidatus Dependentiae bacterium]
MNNKALMQALACFSLLVCQQLMAGDKQVAKLPAAMGSTIAAARDSLNKSFLVARDKKQSLIAEALLVEGLAAGRYEGLEQLVGNEQLNYTTSKSIRIPVPQTRYVVVADFGFAGSGDLDLELMMPLPTVKIRLEANEEVGMSPLVATNASDLVKMCVENEINKMVSRDGGLENLKQLG